jgi:hypothetical protein
MSRRARRRPARRHIEFDINVVDLHFVVLVDVFLFVFVVQQFVERKHQQRDHQRRHRRARTLDGPPLRSRSRSTGRASALGQEPSGGLKPRIKPVT